MLTLLSTVAKVVFFPVWGLWKAYLGLWWAFNEPGRAAPGAGEASASMARPVGLLRAGFAGSMAVSLMAGGWALLLHASEVWGPASAALAWAWITAATMTGSVWLVRRQARRRRTWRERVTAGVAAAAAAAGAGPFRPRASTPETPQASPAGGSIGDRCARAAERLRAAAADPSNRQRVDEAAQRARAECHRAWGVACKESKRMADAAQRHAPEAARRVNAAWDALRGKPSTPPQPPPA